MGLDFLELDVPKARSALMQLVDEASAQREIHRSTTPSLPDATLGTGFTGATRALAQVLTQIHEHTDKTIATVVDGATAAHRDVSTVEAVEDDSAAAIMRAGGRL